MSDPAAMSLDDYIKVQRKKGTFGGRRGGARSGARGGGSSGGSGNNGNRGNNQFRGRKGRQGQGNNTNVQRRRGNRGFGNRNRAVGAGANRGNVQQQRFGTGGSGGGQGQNRRNRNRNNVNRQQKRRQRFSGGGINQAGRSQGLGSNKTRYFNNSGAGALQSVGNSRRSAGRRLRKNRPGQPASGGISVRGRGSIAAAKVNAATQRAFLKLAKKRVQRAKLLVSKKKVSGGGKAKNLLTANNTGRVALGKNGFFTVRNTQSKQLERTLVKLKIARAQKARNRVSGQQQQRQPRSVNMSNPGSSGNRSANRPRPRVTVSNPSARPRPIDWNTSIVRTMRNDLVDDMTSGQLNPEIQQRIAFIQSRSNRDPTPVMQDFKAPVTTSRMKLSDRFRLLSDR